jgi:hypothetical protein
MILSNVLSLTEKYCIENDDNIDVDVNQEILNMTVKELCDIAIHIGKQKDACRDALNEIFSRVEVKLFG